MNLAGVLLFAERPEWIAPQFIVKAVRYPGNEIHVTDYVDTEDYAGPMRKVFDDAMAFVLRNLHKIQAGRGVNAPGVPEIPQLVFEELLVNALIHRDYLVSAPIRLFVFDNRIDIVSPGHLPNSLTVEKIRTGNSIIRNPILVSYVAKGLLPYRGLGSGIQRALDAWPNIDFIDDRDGCLFTATIHPEVAGHDTDLSRIEVGEHSHRYDVHHRVGDPLLGEVRDAGDLDRPERDDPSRLDGGTIFFIAIRTIPWQNKRLQGPHEWRLLWEGEIQ